MTSLVPQMFENTCRTCLSTNGEMVDIFSNDHYVDQIPKKLMAFTKVEITNDDLLPKMICKKCVYLADSFYCFKEQCESADDILKKNLQNCEKITESEITESNSDDDYVVEYISEDVKDEVENAVKRRLDTERKISIKKVSDTVKNLRGIEVLPISDANGRCSSDKKQEVIVFPVKTAKKRLKTVEIIDNDPPQINKRLRIPPETSVIRVNGDDNVKTEDGREKELLGVEPKQENVNVDDNRNSVQCFDADHMATKFAVDGIDEFNCNAQASCADDKSEKEDSVDCGVDEQDSSPADEATPLALLGVNSSVEEKMKMNLKIYKGFRDQSPVSVSRKKSGDVDVKCYQCTICASEYRSMPDVLKHNVKEHMKEIPYVCLICDKIFDDKLSIYEHVDEHNGSKPYECKFCTKRFTLKRNLKRHVNHHINNKPHQCRVCSKKFTQKTSLKSHAYLHTGDSPFSCKTCKVSFSSKNNWKRHVVTIHEKLNTVLCKFCNKELPDKRALSVHLRTHTGDRPYRCPHCDKRFTQQCNLNTHIHCHLNDRPFVCPHCGKGFNQRGTRDDHILTHTGEKPHKCTECEAGFTVASALKRHMWIHTDKDRPHDCKKCKLKFVGLYELRRHLKVRHGEIVKPDNPRVKIVVMDRENIERDSTEAQSSGEGTGYRDGKTEEITAKENNSLSCNVIDKFEETEKTKIEYLLKEEILADNSNSEIDTNEH